MGAVVALVLLVAATYLGALLFAGASFGEERPVPDQAHQHSAPVGCQKVSAKKWNKLRVRELRADGASRQHKKKPVCVNTYRKFKRHVQKVERGLARRLKTDAIFAIQKAFAPLGRVGQAMTVARCESHFNRFAENGQYKGLFQLSANHRSYVRDWTHAYQNAKRAADIVRGDGDWGQWECKP